MQFWRVTKSSNWISIPACFPACLLNENPLAVSNAFVELVSLTKMDCFRIRERNGVRQRRERKRKREWERWWGDSPHGVSLKGLQKRCLPHLLTPLGLFHGYWGTHASLLAPNAHWLLLTNALVPRRCMTLLVPWNQQSGRMNVSGWAIAPQSDHGTKLTFSFPATSKPLNRDKRGRVRMRKRIKNESVVVNGSIPIDIWDQFFFFSVFLFSLPWRLFFDSPSKTSHSFVKVKASRIIGANQYSLAVLS